ncbi:Hypothetical predicted protein [Pelobates cultripes]|uniref:Uncharacterized protein n=1 Tax=Pelobates cultripes TaxID=61616 RepID=A0AAD1VWU2_PELCU|nr:Hypothetical predicted protein [Pelobates cultripes]
MYQNGEAYFPKRKKVPNRFIPNTFRIFDENLYDVRQKEVPKRHTVRQPEKPYIPRSPSRNNMPHPYYAKCIRDNVRFLLEPITHMETASTKHRQTEWWPTEAEKPLSHKPPFDNKTTQRSDFTPIPHSSPQTRHGCNPNKSSQPGIVPLASPESKGKFPQVLLEQTSFKHQYNSRTTPNEPIRGKLHGAFVWKEIKTETKPCVPQGTKPFPNVTGSHSLHQAQIQNGSAVESSMTSPSLRKQGSQQMFNSKTDLSKTDFRETATVFPRIPSTHSLSDSIQPTRSGTCIPTGGILSSQSCVKPMQLAH